MFKDLPEGQTHSENDGCGEKEHNAPKKEKMEKWIEEKEREFIGTFWWKNHDDREENKFSGSECGIIWKWIKSALNERDKEIEEMVKKIRVTKPVTEDQERDYEIKNAIVDETKEVIINALTKNKDHE